MDGSSSDSQFGSDVKSITSELVLQFLTVELTGNLVQGGKSSSAVRSIKGGLLLLLTDRMPLGSGLFRVGLV